MSWLRWGSRQHDQGQKIQTTEPAQLEQAKQQLEQATGEKEILIQRGISLQQELDGCIERKQRRVDMYDDLTNDALGLSWHMTKSLRELKSALEFNDEVLSMSNKRRSSSRAESTVSVLAVLSSSSSSSSQHQQQQQQQKQQTQLPTAPAPSALTITPPGHDDSRPAEPAVWHGYKGAESMFLGPHSSLSPTKKGMIHFARSPATSSLLSMMAAVEPITRATEPPPPGNNPTLSPSTACAAALQLPPPPALGHHRIGQHQAEDSAPSPVTSTGSCSGSSGDTASEGSHEDSTYSCGSSLASDGDTPPLPPPPSQSDSAETDCCDVIRLRSRSTTPTISISKEVLNAHALATAAAVAANSSSSSSGSAASAKLACSPSVASASFSLQRRRSSCSFSSATQACAPLDEIVGTLASSSSSSSSGTIDDAEFASLAARYSDCWSVFSAAQTVIDTLRMGRDSQRAFLSGARRLRDSLGNLSRGVIDDFEAEEDEIKFILSYDFDLGGRIHESFSCKVRGASSSCRLKGSGASSSSTSALSALSSSSSVKAFSFRRGNEVSSSAADQPPPRGLTRSRSLSFKSVTSLIPSPFRRKPSVDSSIESSSPAPAAAPATPTAASWQATAATASTTAAQTSPARGTEDSSAPAADPSSPLYRAGVYVEELRRAISAEQRAKAQVEELGAPSGRDVIR